jgi:glucosamine--fructose-6-phosphate aminotransferase (isomerizing)
MCGIVSYAGGREAFPIIVEGLKRLEYRGYDSAGVAVMDGEVKTFKKKGRVKDLEEHIRDADVSGGMGIGHTRWATHGAPEDRNAHPHLSGDGTIALVHNGIIENYASLKQALSEMGHTFKSDTDTEVLVHLIEEIRNRDQLSLTEAVRTALSYTVGAFAIAVMDSRTPDIMVGARKSSPLVIGLGENEVFLASDVSPFIKYTNRVIYLKDGEIVTIHKDGNYAIINPENEVQHPHIKELELKLEEIELGEFPHFMLKEIYQQPNTIHETMRGRLHAGEGWINVGGVTEHLDKLADAKRMIFLGCGTSWHAALVGEYLFEDLARIPVEVEYASEFRYRNPVMHKDDIVLALSQSGESADTLEALKLAQEAGILTYGIVNVVASSIARLTDCGSYTHAGPEIGVASTKAFTSQLIILSMMAMQIGLKRKTISESYFMELLHEMERLPEKVSKILEQDDKIRFISQEIKDFSNALYLGRGYNFPIALEGALKLKEISYIHAEGYPAAEMKHGPIALIDEQMPVIVIANNMSAHDKIVSNIQEVKARGAQVISIITEGDQKIRSMSDYWIEIPETLEPLSPILSVIPLQLLAYHIASIRGCDVDKPRNLAKSVTVE